MKLMNDDDVKTMFSILNQYSNKWSIELDASLVRSFQDIKKSLIQPITCEDIRVLIEEPNKEVNLVDPWYVMFCFITFFYVVELCCLIYLRLLYLMYFDEIKFYVLKLVLCRMNDNSSYIIRICQVQVFSVVNIVPTVFVVHIAHKLV